MRRPLPICTVFSSVRAGSTGFRRNISSIPYSMTASTVNTLLLGFVHMRAAGTMAPTARQTSNQRESILRLIPSGVPPKRGVSNLTPRYFRISAADMPNRNENDTTFRNLARSSMSRTMLPSRYVYRML